MMTVFKYLNGAPMGDCILHYTRRKNLGQRVELQKDRFQLNAIRNFLITKTFEI